MLKHLNLQEMVGLTSPWVNEPTVKATFLSIPEIAAFHPQVVELHVELAGAQPLGAPRSKAMQDLIDQAALVDVLHDALARAVEAGIDADRLCSLARKPPEHARAKLAEEVSTKLFPSGMTIVNASYLGESGNVERVRTLLAAQPAITAFLEEIPVRGGTLLALTKRWLAAGKKLGKLEVARGKLAAKESTTPRDSSTITRLRGRWIRLVSLVLSALELSKADAEAIHLIRGAVLEASERAGKRYDPVAALASAEAPVDEDEAPAEGAA